jgi:hypothetical protein
MSQATATNRPTSGNAAAAATSAPATGNATANASGNARSGYEVFHLGIGKTNAPIMEGINALSKKLGCRPQNLAWEAMRLLVANPPTTAPAGATAPTGKSAGFWVIRVVDGNNRNTGFEVREVSNRGQVKGPLARTFVRYDREDIKSRGRAERQAIRAAQSDCDMVGLSHTTIKTTYLAGSGPSPAPQQGVAPAAAASAA